MNTAQKATKSQGKEHNKRLVLQTLYDHGQISRAGIARVTRLTRPTVSNLVAELMDEGLVNEVGQKPSAGGKPATLLSVAADARHLIGVDLANSEFRGAVVNLRGDILHRLSKPVEDRDGEKALALLYDLLDELIAATHSPLLGIGIGTPGIMDAGRGVVRRAVNLDWRDLPLAALLQARYGFLAYVVNDSQAAALAQYTFGSDESFAPLKDKSFAPLKDKRSRNLVLLKVGRGVGAGIVLDGQLYYGDGSGAGEIGHFVVADQGERCRCGNVGCLETVAGSRAIVRQAQELARHDPGSLLHRVAASPDQITTAAVVQAHAAGDEAVRGMVAAAGRTLGIAAAALVSTLNIQQIVVAGPVAAFGEGLLAPMRQEMRRRAMASLVDETTIAVSQLGEDIVILGSAAFLLNRELGLV